MGFSRTPALVASRCAGPGAEEEGRGRRDRGGSDLTYRPGLEEGPTELRDTGDFTTSPLQPSTSIIWGDFF